MRRSHLRLDSFFFSLGVQNECGKDEGNKGREKRMEPRIVSVCVCVRSSALLGDRKAGRLLKGTKTIPVDVYLVGKCSWLLPLFSWNPMNEVSAELH